MTADHPPAARTYYGRSVLKAPVWKWPVPAYFFTGGVAAGTSLLAAGARLTGDHRFARRCLLASLGATAVSTAFLVEDLGRPERFLNMLRVAKPTSPMNVGSWILTAFGSATGVAAAGEVLGVATPLGRAAEGIAAVLAPALGTYTAVLVADTAVPAWHEARHELPFLFAGGAMAGSGGLALLLSTGTEGLRPARRVAMTGAALELVMSTWMQRRLGDLGEPYRHGRAGALSKFATAAAAVGGVIVAATGRRWPVLARTAGVLLMAGAAAERFAVFEAGVESAQDPAATVVPQRARVDAGTTRPAHPAR